MNQILIPNVIILILRYNFAPFFPSLFCLVLSLALPLTFSFFAFQEFNRDQARAIACGLAMIKRTQKTPKFLLIHGPPGTGKSKTIGGLLYKLLSSVFVFLVRMYLYSCLL